VLRNLHRSSRAFTTGCCRAASASSFVYLCLLMSRPDPVASTACAPTHNTSPPLARAIRLCGLATPWACVHAQSDCVASRPHGHVCMSRSHPGGNAICRSYSRVSTDLFELNKTQQAGCHGHFIGAEMALHVLPTWQSLQL